MKSTQEFGEENLLSIWEHQSEGAYRAELYYIGTDHVGYRFYCNGKLIFEGTDFRPSPMYAQDSPEALFGLLGFLSLKKGDIEKEFFAHYTAEQIRFRDKYAEDLSICVSDFENDSDDGHDYRAEVLAGFKAA